MATRPRLPRAAGTVLRRLGRESPLPAPDEWFGCWGAAVWLTCSWKEGTSRVFFSWKNCWKMLR